MSVGLGRKGDLGGSYLEIHFVKTLGGGGREGEDLCHATLNPMIHQNLDNILSKFKYSGPISTMFKNANTTSLPYSPP